MRKIGQNEAFQEEKYNDKSTFHLPRQEVAFWEECRKIKDCGSLKRDFYTRFKPKNKGFGDVTWWE